MRGVFWWVDRWRNSAAYVDMTAEEQALFRNLNDEVWLREDHVIPESSLARASGFPDLWPRLGARVLKFMKSVDGGWTIEDSLQVIRESEVRSERQRRYRNKHRNGDRNADRNGRGNAGGNEARNDAPSPDLDLDLEQDQSQKVKPSASVVSPPASEPSGLFGPDGPDGETRPEPQKSKAEPNGAKILADLWAELCPHLDQPRRPLAPGIARSLVASWKRDPDADLWRERFAFVAESDTYSGRKPGFSWKADISWATGPKNSAKLDAKANRNHEAPVENFSDYNRRSAEQAKRIRLPWETEDVAPWDTEALPDESQRDPAPPVRLISSQPASDEAAVAAKVNGIVRGFLNGHR